MFNLFESKAGKNLHLEHIEDEILNFGVPGGRAAINFVRSLRDMLAGESRSSVNMTVKWDGAPAIFAGKDPSDGKFFVAKKSVFNEKPLLYKSVKEIQDAAELSVKALDKDYKNQILMLDILSKNDWERPIYFTGGSYKDSEYIWMKDYFFAFFISSLICCFKCFKFLNFFSGLINFLKFTLITLLYKFLLIPKIFVSNNKL